MLSHLGVGDVFAGIVEDEYYTGGKRYTRVFGYPGPEDTRFRLVPNPIGPWQSIRPPEALLFQVTDVRHNHVEIIPNSEALDQHLDALDRQGSYVMRNQELPHPRLDRFSYLLVEIIDIKRGCDHHEDTAIFFLPALRWITGVAHVKYQFRFDKGDWLYALVMTKQNDHRRPGREKLHCWLVPRVSPGDTLDVVVDDAEPEEPTFLTLPGYQGTIDMSSIDCQSLIQGSMVKVKVNSVQGKPGTFRKLHTSII